MGGAQRNPPFAVISCPLLVGCAALHPPYEFMLEVVRRVRGAFGTRVRDVRAGIEALRDFGAFRAFNQPFGIFLQQQPFGDEFLRGFAEYRMIIYSLLIIALMLLRPQGLFAFQKKAQIRS